MKDEYDFSQAEQGKFFVPAEAIQIPVYLDPDIAQFLGQKCGGGADALQTMVNDRLRKDIEIARWVAA
ncbi:hypothetical protein SAMN02949497_0605 [Methylomagnum ishizawai]|uniref:BrnA antitoxin of type II toxin-antitoxin system n=1 Tax=Methylomagnum ishizawai TaxID=1760988 RepID=A0A1Y6CSQ3_9GAMM|nr:hypothetical protein [Methylomagnum ishizawai]SMF93327.1 hypothetical protein SAMN02949497_0605 [Methylomagnum ishizawai]